MNGTTGAQQARRTARRRSAACRAAVVTLAMIIGAGSPPVSAAESPRVGSAEAPAAARSGYAEVHGARMHYLEQGKGSAVLFVHGNPTSSYLWRNVMPLVAQGHRAIAVDLIGMGRSDKPDIEYSYDDHLKFLEGFIESLGLSDVTLVVHDWGATLGFDYARLHPGRVRRIAFMEGVLPPSFPQPSYDALGPEMGGMFRALRDPVSGRELVLEQNIFLEKLLPQFVMRQLEPAEIAEYKRPYQQPATRMPLWMWPRELPIGGEPRDMTERFSAIETYLRSPGVPVLLLYAEPGVLVPPAAVPWYTSTIPKLETAFIGKGLHFIQEDQPVAIGRALVDWMRRN